MRINNQVIVWRLPLGLFVCVYVYRLMHEMVSRGNKHFARVFVSWCSLHVVVICCFFFGGRHFQIYMKFYKIHFTSEPKEGPFRKWSETDHNQPSRICLRRTFEMYQNEITLGAARLCGLTDGRTVGPTDRQTKPFREY